MIGPMLALGANEFEFEFQFDKQQATSSDKVWKDRDAKARLVVSISSGGKCSLAIKQKR